MAIDRETFSDPAALAGALAGVEAVLHFAGVNRGPEDEVERGNPAIAEALVATAVGLLIAIPAVAMYNFYQRLSKSILANTNALSHVLLSYLVAVLGIALASAAVYAWGTASAYPPLPYLWVVLFVFYFFRLRPALAHMALVAIGYALVLALEDAGRTQVDGWIAAIAPLVIDYLQRGLELGAPSATEPHLAVFGATLGWAWSLRLLASVVLIVPTGIAMGCCFPLGMLRFGEAHKAWFWALNGAAGVFASEVSLALCMEFGFSLVAAFGAALYDERITLAALGGAALVACGLLVAQWRRPLTARPRG